MEAVMDFTKLKDFMDGLTHQLVPGNSAVVYKDGKKVFEYSSGYADLEKGVKMTGEELIYIYSCSKPATAAAAMQLYERGAYLLSDPIYDYMPEFKDMYVKTDNGIRKAENHITVGQLLTMTAGFSYDTQTPEFDEARRITGGKMDTLEVISCIAKEPLTFEPGERWQYSLCHDVLAGLIEVVSGKRFSEYMRENIFEPLDMKNSFYHLPEGQENRMARQYIYKDGDETDIVKLQQSTGRNGKIMYAGMDNSLVFGENYDSGGAGIITTAGDYAKFIAALANKGMGLNGNRILSSGTVELMKTNMLTAEQMKYYTWRRLRGYGYGLGVRTLISKSESGSNGSIGEIGWGGAAGATVLADTDKDLALFYAHHMLNPQEEYYQPRLRNVLYSCIDE